MRQIVVQVPSVREYLLTVEEVKKIRGILAKIGDECYVANFLRENHLPHSANLITEIAELFSADPFEVEI